MPSADRSHINAWLQQAFQAAEAGQTDDAIAAFRQIAVADPSCFEAWANLGLLLRDIQPNESAKCYSRAVEIQPHNGKLVTAFIGSLRSARRPEDALPWCERLMNITGQDWDVRALYGNVLQECERFDESLSYLAAAVEAHPEHAPYWNFLGILRHRRGEIDEAQRCFQESLTRDPGSADVRFHLSMSQLLTGDFARGWEGFEYRPGGRFCQRTHRPWPLWDGQPLGPRKILLAAEQGLGDTVQAIRWARHVKQRFGGSTILYGQASLLPLLQGCAGIDVWIGRNEPLPEFDCFVPLMSLPSLLGDVAGTSPKPVPHKRGPTNEDGRPYLRPDPVRQAIWRARLTALRESWQPTPRLQIAIAWQGDPSFAADKSRSIQLTYFSHIATVPGVQLISLQRGVGTEQIGPFQQTNRLVQFGQDLDRTGGAFMDTAAILSCVDLLIASDSAIVHVAGALGVPLWIALPAVPDWRCGLTGERSPWYPSARLFRQDQQAGWGGVFSQMARELSQFPASKG